MKERDKAGQTFATPPTTRFEKSDSFVESVVEKSDSFVENSHSCHSFVENSDSFVENSDSFVNKSDSFVENSYSFVENSDSFVESLVGPEVFM